MNIQQCVDKSEWDAALSGMHGASFLQSWDWGELQKAGGRRVFRHLLMSNGRACAAVQWIEMPLPSNMFYWFAPYGPVVLTPPTSSEYARLSHELLTQSVELEKDSLPVFLRIEPRVESCAESVFLLWKSESHLRNAPSVQPRDTRIIDLDADEQLLLKSLHQKTRYNIRLAEKKGVRILKGDSYIDDFIHLNHETAKRDAFVSHPDAHYMNMVTYLPKGMRDVYAAEYEGAVIAANIVVHFHNVTTYAHGASSSEHRNVMAPHLLQWRQILDAKERGMRTYDFFGIAPSNMPSEKSERWKGITRFKEGFGGIEKNYVGTWDLPIQKVWYTLYNVVRSIRH